MNDTLRNIIAIIPARLSSTRLPRKVLADIGGKSMLHRVHDRVSTTGLFTKVIVATDSEEVMMHCIQHNMQAIITSDDHPSGTDRVAEVARMIDADIVVNVQADEPFVEKESLEALVNLMTTQDIGIGTVMRQIADENDLFDYNIVKMAADRAGRVLYFSRQAIPANRSEPYRLWLDKHTYYQHLGIYAFKASVLSQITKLPISALEQIEKLEQLRWLEHGYEIYSTKVVSTSFGIDTEEDLARARKYVEMIRNSQ